MIPHVPKPKKTPQWVDTIFGIKGKDDVVPHTTSSGQPRLDINETMKSFNVNISESAKIRDRSSSHITNALNAHDNIYKPVLDLIQENPGMSLADAVRKIKPGKEDNTIKNIIDVIVFIVLNPLLILIHILKFELLF